MYSQKDEEKYIVDFFKDKQAGRFLDIGAYNGKTFSNTHALALNGWGGLCIEPSPKAFSDLINLYRDRKDIELINVAVISDYIKIDALHVLYDANGDAISTMNEHHKEKWQANAKYHRIYIRPIHITDIYKQFGRYFDFINIDIEGNSIDVLEGMDLSTPQMICVEYDNQEARLNVLMETYGFDVLHKNDENVIMVKK